MGITPCPPPPPHPHGAVYSKATTNVSTLTGWIAVHINRRWSHRLASPSSKLLSKNNLRMLNERNLFQVLVLYDLTLFKQVTPGLAVVANDCACAPPHALSHHPDRCHTVYTNMARNIPRGCRNAHCQT